MEQQSGFHNDRWLLSAADVGNHRGSRTGRRSSGGGSSSRSAQHRAQQTKKQAVLCDGWVLGDAWYCKHAGLTPLPTPSQCTRARCSSAPLRNCNRRTPTTMAGSRRTLGPRALTTTRVLTGEQPPRKFPAALSLCPYSRATAFRNRRRRRFSHRPRHPDTGPGTS
ncbi:uncharacterized protein LOC142575999 [Dermacentor variabilis]|uniref:uncharacterized protein LOC142575999 n=1 Tax=Dermacentor variabilis TaxID=34621 RepID=UPI003F5BB6E5